MISNTTQFPSYNIGGKSYYLSQEAIDKYNRELYENQMRIHAYNQWQRSILELQRREYAKFKKLVGMWFGLASSDKDFLLSIGCDVFSIKNFSFMQNISNILKNEKKIANGFVLKTLINSCSVIVDEIKHLDDKLLDGKFTNQDNEVLSSKYLVLKISLIEYYIEKDKLEEVLSSQYVFQYSEYYKKENSYKYNHILDVANAKVNYSLFLEREKERKIHAEYMKKYEEQVVWYNYQVHLTIQEAKKKKIKEEIAVYERMYQNYIHFEKWKKEQVSKIEKRKAADYVSSLDFKKAS